MKALRLTEQQFSALKGRTKKLAAQVVAKPEQPDRYPLILRDQIVEAGLPEPFREFVWHPTRNFRADLAWPALKQIVEVDGAVHRMKDKFARDIERHNLLMMQGWRYLRVTPQMVRSGEALTVVKTFLNERT